MTFLLLKTIHFKLLRTSAKLLSPWITFQPENVQIACGFYLGPIWLISPFQIQSFPYTLYSSTCNPGTMCVITYRHLGYWTWCTPRFSWQINYSSKAQVPRFISIWRISALGCLSSATCPTLFATPDSRHSNLESSRIHITCHSIRLLPQIIASVLLSQHYPRPLLSIDGASTDLFFRGYMSHFLYSRPFVDRKYSQHSNTWSVSSTPLGSMYFWTWSSNTFPENKVLMRLR